MKVILVDDEKAPVTILKHKLLKIRPDIQIIATCNNDLEAINAIETLKPDLVFMDIEMPNQSGFDIVAKFKNPDFFVIFATAHEEFILKALRAHAIDYLLKPIDEEELSNALAKVQDLLNQKAMPTDSVAQLMDYFKHSKAKLQIPTMDGTHFIPYEDVIRIEADGSYSHIYSKNRKKITTSKALCEFDFLDNGRNEFIKVHKSNIININMVSKYKRGDGGIAIMVDDAEIDIARRRKDDFIKKLSLNYE
jgi:two-component system LytT family response regulator